jgi:hypothetical protein
MNGLALTCYLEGKPRRQAIQRWPGGDARWVRTSGRLAAILRRESAGAGLAGRKKYAEAEPLLLAGYRGIDARKEKIGVPDRYYLDRGTRMDRASLLSLGQAGEELPSGANAKFNTCAQVKASGHAGTGPWPSRAKWRKESEERLIWKSGI